MMKRLIYATGGVSTFSILGQLTVVATIPLLTRLYSPFDFGVFTIYLGIVNILAATAALRLDASLYVVAAGEDACATLKLILVAIVTTSLLTSGVLVLLSSVAPDHLHDLAYLVPIGMAVTGLVESMNCWTLRQGRLHDFAIGRLIAPSAMALSQLSFGALRWGGEAMVLAHILSQLMLIGFLGIRAFTWNELGRVTRIPWKRVIAIARQEYKFPIFDLPATFLAFATINLPAILIGTLFGTSLAGHFGVAARLFSSPISLIALPLSNVFVSEFVKSTHTDAPFKIGLVLVLLASILITFPALAVGAAAPLFVVPLLGSDWTETGQMITALALAGATQALATPVQEVSTLLRRQGLRLLVDVVRAILVFAPLALGVHGGWDPLHIVYAMSGGGAIGYLIKLAVSLHLLRGDSRRHDKPLRHVRILGTETGEVV